VQWFPLRRHHCDPSGDQLGLLGKIGDYFWHITLPVLAMVVGGFAVITILVKNSVLEEIRKQYVLTARAKGVAEGRVLWRHVFRNAMIPIMTGFPAAFVGAFFSGALLIETLFPSTDWDCFLMNRSYAATIRSYSERFFIFTLIGLLTHLIRDLSYVWADPRVSISIDRVIPRLPQLTLRSGFAAAAASQESPARRAWRRFRGNRLGYLSLVAFAVLFSISLIAEVLSTTSPLVVRYEANGYFRYSRLSRRPHSAATFQARPTTSIR